MHAGSEAHKVTPSYGVPTAQPLCHPSPPLFAALSSLPGSPRLSFLRAALATSLSASTRPPTPSPPPAAPPSSSASSSTARSFATATAAASPPQLHLAACAPPCPAGSLRVFLPARIPEVTPHLVTTNHVCTQNHAAAEIRRLAYRAGMPVQEERWKPRRSCIWARELSCQACRGRLFVPRAARHLLPGCP